MCRSQRGLIVVLAAVMLSQAIVPCCAVVQLLQAIKSDAKVACLPHNCNCCCEDAQRPLFGDDAEEPNQEPVHCPYCHGQGNTATVEQKSPELDAIAQYWSLCLICDCVELRRIEETCQTTAGRDSHFRLVTRDVLTLCLRV